MIGTSLGHFEIIGSIGAGAMGQIYRARDTKLGREVAIKMLPAALRENETALARFRREAQALAALNHPNIVTIYSIEDESEELFITMELVDGETLQSRIRDGGMDPDQFRKIALPLTGALAAAHRSEIVHRDLKPANIIVTTQGDVKVLDFGLARMPYNQSVTDSNIAVGTAAYMSPEQITCSDVDRRSDLFSLGIIFHELLSGRRPFEGEHLAAVMYGIVHETPAPLTGVSRSLAEVIDRCLRKSPADRFDTAEELSDAIERSLDSPPDTPSGAEDLSQSARRAFETGAWGPAYDQFDQLRSLRDLTGDELAMMSRAAIWLTDYDQYDKLLEQSYAAYINEQSNRAAAKIAIELGNAFRLKNAHSVAQGWLKRAERLLKGEPECVEQGYLLRRQTMMALGKNQIDEALVLNEKCRTIAERFSDRDLVAEALHDQGQILIVRGDVEQGTELIDEAMASSVSGDLDPMTVGTLYCRTMGICEALADFRRAKEWSEMAWRWCEPYAASPYPGVCRVHSAATMRHLGMWAEAEQAVRNACEDFVKQGQTSHASDAYNELGELALRKGDYDEAESAFNRAHEFGYDPVPGLPLLRVAQGKPDVAQQIMERALGECGDDRLAKARLLGPMAFVALANGDTDRAQLAIDELDPLAKDYGCASFKAQERMGRGAIELARGRPQDATRWLKDSWTILNEQGLTYDAARARTWLARAYLANGDKEDALMQLKAAQKTFQDLGAKPDLAAALELKKQIP
jgi:serine/threonine protein kinase